jgi:hypothetical protein
MANASPVRGWALPIAGLAALAWSLSAWLPAVTGPTVAAQDTQDLLRGTWLREYREEGVQVRRVLELAAGGAFHESVRVAEASGRVTQYTHEGTWIYDGTNLKRKYTSMNGQPPSRLKAPFATFEVTFQSSNEFTGVDHVHGHHVSYHRVAPDTQP